MYCSEPANKKSKLFVPETQYPDDDYDEISLLRSPEKLNNRKINLSAEDTSPVLQKSNNTHKKLMKHGSFSKLKMLSKFQRTSIDENLVVQSRFFNAELPETPENSENDAIKNVNVSISDIGKLELNSSIENNAVEKSPIKPNNVTSPSRNPFKKIESNTAVIENTLDVCNLLTPRCSEDLSVIESEKINDRNSFSDKIDINFEEIKKPSIKQTPRSVCRQSSLKRNNSGSVSQQSLLTVFGFQKKCKLKH